MSHPFRLLSIRRLSTLALAVAAHSLFGQAAPTSRQAISIEQLVRDVLASNPEANFYQAEIAAAKGEARTATTLRNPELSAELGNKRVRSTTGAALGDGAAWSVSVRQTFEFPGRLALRKAIASRQVELSEIGYAQFQAALAGRARGLAYDIFVAQQRVGAAREVADRMQALQEVLIQRDPAGLTPLLEARILEANALTLQRRASQAELVLLR